jgi:hypothetical protein
MCAAAASCCFFVIGFGKPLNRDQEKRKHDNRVVGWFLILGYAVVTPVVFVVWRKRLL